MTSKNVLVLFSFKSHKYGYIEMLFDRLTTAAKDSMLQLRRGSLAELRIAISDNHMSIKESLTGRDLSDFDLLYFELWYKAPEQALAAALYARRHNIPFFSSELEQLVPMTKVGELAKLADTGVPLPRSFMSSNRQILKTFKSDAPIDYPVIVKAADGYGGKNNYLVPDFTTLERILGDNKSLRFVVQEFIPNDHDYRCLVMGGQIRLVLKRIRGTDDTHLNNTSAGAEGIVVSLEELSEQAQADVLKAAAVLNRDEFGGVDLLINKETRQHYILEVNQTPQIEIGAAVDQKMAALLGYMNDRLRKEKE